MSSHRSEEIIHGHQAWGRAGARLLGEPLQKPRSLVRVAWTMAMETPAAGVFRRPDVSYREVSQF